MSNWINAKDELPKLRGFKMSDTDLLDKLIKNAINVGTYQKAAKEGVFLLDIMPADARCLAGFLQELRDYRNTEAQHQQAIDEQRELAVKWAMSQGFVTGHASTLKDLLDEVSLQITELRDSKNEAVISALDDFREEFLHSKPPKSLLETISVIKAKHTSKG